MRFLSSFRRWSGKLGRSEHKVLLGTLFALIIVIGLAGPGHAALALPNPIVALALSDPIAAAGTWAIDQLVLTLTTIIQFLTGALGMLALWIINMLVTPILQYNGFSSSPTIGLGWKLVRDVVNMFVVLVLLVIAMATIVGYEKASWQKNLPQFLLAVVLVNFSRTICGVLIDISQVVMFTFVNALLETMGGNFTRMLNFDGYGLYSTTATYDALTGEPVAISPYQQFGAAYLQFILYGCIVAVLLLLTLVFIWRIIVLWVLVIMSPLTFFSWGVGGMFKFAAGASGDWWKKFTAALTIGPMLTFFLWLALSTATGDIAADEHFKTSDAVGTTALLEGFEPSNLLGTFLALVLLVVGMQQSAAAASSLGGLAKKAMGDEKMGQKLVGGAIGLAGGYAARGVARGVGNAAKGGAQRGAAVVGNWGAGKGIELGSAVGGLKYGGVLGKTMINAAGSVQQKAQAVQKAGSDAAKKRIGAETVQQRAAQLSLLANDKTIGLTPSGRDEIKNRQLDYATNAKSRKAFKELNEKQGKSELTGKMDTAALKFADKNEADFDDAEKKGANKLRTQKAHLFGKAFGRNGQWDDESRKKLRKHIDSEDFVGNDLTPEASAHPEVHRALEQNQRNPNKKGRNALEKLRKGQFGSENQSAAGGTPDIDDDGASTPPPTPPPQPPSGGGGAAPVVAGAVAGAAAGAAVGGAPGYGFNRPPRPPRPPGGGGGGGGGGPSDPSGGTPPATPTGGGPAPAAPQGGGGSGAGFAAPQNGGSNTSPVAPSVSPVVTPSSAQPSAPAPEPLVSFDNPSAPLEDEPLVSFDDPSVVPLGSSKPKAQPNTRRRPPRPPVYRTPKPPTEPPSANA